MGLRLRAVQRADPLGSRLRRGAVRQDQLRAQLGTDIRARFTDAADTDDSNAKRFHGSAHQVRHFFILHSLHPLPRRDGAAWQGLSSG